jgi:hypothetical protein
MCYPSVITPWQRAKIFLVVVPLMQLSYVELLNMLFF